MGFDAIWVTPIIKNLEGGYHGYWATDLYSLNENFGTDQDFKDLVSALHERNMWIMVDVVGNHMGPVGQDYSGVNPFNQPEHYHDYCIIEGDDFQNNQDRVENCRLADLPDLKQENNFVRTTLLTWIHDFVSKHDLDGLRVDTIPEVPKWFWDQFQKSAGVYAVGEVFDGRLDYVSDYQNHIDGLLNYPLRFAMLDVWRGGQGFYRLKDQIDAGKGAFKDYNALGVFVDNHDNARYLNGNSDHKGLEAATIFSMFSEGIPIVYYGTEQYFGGGNDPANREPLWNNFDKSSNLYKMLKASNDVRKSHQVWSGKYVERYIDDHFLAFSRNDVLICLTNTDNFGSKFVSSLPFDEGETVCNIFDSSDCQTVQGGINVDLSGYLTKVYVKKSSLSNFVTE